MSPLVRRIVALGRYAAARAYWLVFRPLTVGVRAVVLDGESRVILVRHSYQMSHGWYLPGGGVKRGERLRDALARELREEVGVELRGEPVLLGVYSNLAEHKSDHVVVFVVREWVEGPPTQRIEIAEVGRFPLDDLPHDLTPATRRRLAELAGSAALDFLW